MIELAFQCLHHIFNLSVQKSDMTTLLILWKILASIKRNYKKKLNFKHRLLYITYIWTFNHSQ